jgi:hypothetical protein
MMLQAAEDIPSDADDEQVVVRLTEDQLCRYAASEQPSTRAKGACPGAGCSR